MTTNEARSSTCAVIEQATFAAEQLADFIRALRVLAASDAR